MKKTFQESILNELISGLPFSPEFQQAAKLNHYQKLADLLKLEYAQDLLQKPGFDHRLLHEYVSFLKEQGLGFYLV